MQQASKTGSKRQSLSEQVFPRAVEAHAELFSDKTNYPALHKHKLSLITQCPAPALNWDPQQHLNPSRSILHLPWIQECILIPTEGVTCPRLSICSDILRIRSGGSTLEDSGICCLCSPQLSHTASHILLSFGSDWQTLELWKGRKSLGEAQRYFYRSLWPPTPIIYTRIRMLLHREKK